MCHILDPRAFLLPLVFVDVQRILQEYLEAAVKNFAAILDFFTICATMNNKGMAAIELIKTVGLVEVYTPK